MGRKKAIEDSDLLAIAREEFLKHGAWVSMRVIAKKAGFTLSALCQRIPYPPENQSGTKHDLFIAAMMPPRVQAADIIAQMPRGPSTRNCLVAAANALLKYLGEVTPQLLPLMMDTGVGEEGLRAELNQDPFIVLKRVVTDSLYPEVKARRISEKEAGTLANALVLALFGLSILQTAGYRSNMARKTTAATIVDAVWHGPRSSKRRKP